MNTTVARFQHGLVATIDGQARRLGTEQTIDELLRSSDPLSTLAAWHRRGTDTHLPRYEDLLAPLESQEVWAAGVTYQRSRSARMSESAAAGSDSFYDRVYDAERPELFFKATPNRVADPGKGVRIRSDSSWDVPEPELTLVVSATSQIVGYTIGNDMSSRSIEGENPLYLPQAKVYSNCASVGPWLTFGDAPEPETVITMTIRREQSNLFSGATRVGELRRTFDELVHYLFRDNEFPNGVLLMTGTGIIPPDDFTLKAGDVVEISIEGLGSLVNHVTVDV